MTLRRIAVVFAGVLMAALITPLVRADVFTCFGHEATIVGTNGDDVLHGTAGPDVIVGMDGDDSIDGGAGDDVICGGAGNDPMDGGDGDDVGVGGPGSDRWVDGSPDVDAGCVPDESPGTFYGGDGNDVVDISGDGDYEVFGGNGDDVILGGDGDDKLRGGLGKDLIAPDDGDDLVDGGADVDTVDYTEDLHLHHIGPAIDLCGRRSPLQDSVRVSLERGSASGINSGIGSDVLLAVENVSGGQNTDELTGDSGPNVIRGGAGEDFLDGGVGDDVLDGGVGQDTCADPDSAIRKSCEVETFTAGSQPSSGSDFPWWMAVIVGAGGCALLVGVGWLFSRRPSRQRPAEAQPR